MKKLLSFLFGGNSRQQTNGTNPSGNNTTNTNGSTPIGTAPTNDRGSGTIDLMAIDENQSDKCYDCPTDNLIFRSCERNRDVYKRIIKYIIKQDSARSSGTLFADCNDPLLVNYPPVSCSSHTTIIIPSVLVDEDHISSKKLITWGGKKNIPKSTTSPISKILNIPEDALLTYYDCGLNMWKYAEQTTQPDTVQRPNPSLFYHSFTFNPKNNKIYIYGGSSNKQRTSSFLVSNNLFSVSVDSWEWKHYSQPKVEIHPEDFHYIQQNNIAAITSLTPVRGHSAIYRSRTNSLVFYAGNLGGTRLTNDMIEFDCATERWFFIPQHNAVPARAYHNAVYCKSRDWMIVFGGECFDTNSNRLEIVNEMSIFDFTDRRWTTIKFKGNMREPFSTFGHCTTIIYDRFVVSYGGCDREYNPKNQFLIIDLVERRWTKLMVDFTPSITDVSAKHILDSSANQHLWKMTYSQSLPPLNCSSATFDEETSSLMFFGGYTTSKDKCSSIFRVRLDLPLISIPRHFKLMDHTIATFHTETIISDVTIIFP